MTTEGERIVKLETQMNNIENKVDEGFKASEKQIEDVKNLLTNFIEKSEKKFASKWVEKAIWSAASIVGTSVLLAVLSLVLIQ